MAAPDPSKCQLLDLCLLWFWDFSVNHNQLVLLSRSSSSIRARAKIQELFATSVVRKQNCHNFFTTKHSILNSVGPKSSEVDFRLFGSLLVNYYGQRGSYGLQIGGADNNMGKIFVGAEHTFQHPHSIKRAKYWGCCSTPSPPYNYLTG